ncbi:MAG: hypothetical protein IJY33_02185 [Oscillospiraceae bacterium]|nr:hypothetical protein [Oscillospiraceae bacterium]
MSNNANYKKMYFTLLDASEKAIEILVEGQHKAEDIYVETCGDEEENNKE